MRSLLQRAARFTTSIPALGGLRGIRDEKLSADVDAVDELLKSAVRTKGPRNPLTSTRREALSLYREILRYSNLFVWRDAKGRPFRELLRESARKEFEDARIETDPEIINKLIITGRDCVQRTVESFAKQRQMIIDEEARAAEQGAMHAPGRRPH